MSCRILLVVAAVLVAVCALPYSGQNRAPTVTERIISEGYPAESYEVTTPDGYILGLHRIPYGKAGPSAGKRPVVFVMHGLMGSSENFIFLGAKSGIAYNLADAGFDVWMGNARGNFYSRRHVSLNPDHWLQKGRFFDFSWEEIALIDLPAMITHALEVSGQEKLHYIGHSQGGTVFLVLNSIWTVYNDKFLSAHLLAGVGYKNHFPNSQLRSVAQMSNTLYNLATSVGLVEIQDLSDLSFSSSRQGYTAIDNCFGDVAYKDLCNSLGLDSIVGERIIDGMVGGASVKQFAHYGQNIRDKAFQRWDHGSLTNRLVYGSINPPKYDISRISVPTTMHYTVSDELLDEQDVLAMANSMPNAQARKIARETFTHVDFIAADDARELVTKYVLESLSQFEH